MKKDDLALCIYKFTELSDRDIADIRKIYTYWHQEQLTPEAISKGLYIKDAVDFKKLRAVNYDGHGIGRIFCLERNGEKLAYVLSFDTLDFPGKREHYLKLLSPFVKADRSFIYNLIYLEHIAFIFHVGVAEEHQQMYLGKELLNRTMDYYVATKKTRLVASTLDSGQFGMIRKLENERPNMVFLNQEFSEQKQSTREIRVRVAELIDLKTFRKKINDSYLQGTYDFVIPMQLNIATETVNRMLQETNLEVKILWTSFFHNVPELKRLNNINEFYHGFYQPIRESALNKWAKIRQQQIQTLRDISGYLKEKHNGNADSPGVASLIPSMEKEGFEFFFINDDPDHHDFLHFATPKVYRLDDEQAVQNWLKSEEHYLEQKDTKPLTPEEKRQWYRALSRYVKAIQLNAYESSIAMYRKAWVEWRDLLQITPEEEKQLIAFQNQVIREGTQRIPDFGDLVKKINKRPLINKNKREQWQEWFSLHRKLYESDTLLMTPDERQKWWWCHGVVPISFSQGISGVMFTFICKKPTKADTDTGKIKVVAALADIIANSLSRNMLNIVNKLYLNNFKTAISRFKTAAISARNLSHNVGSHVYSFLSQPNELTDIIWKGIPPEEIPDNFSELQGLKRLTKFFDFTKVRMSLLADMATNEPVASTTEWLYDNLIHIFQNQDILKQYVTGNANRSVTVSFYNRDVGRKKIKIKENGKTKLVDEPIKDWLDRQASADIQIQVPNGILGKSAFLMIMVNYLRNSIKYAPYEQPNDVELTLSVKSVDKSQRLYKITLHDNVERLKAKTVSLIDTINDKFIHRDSLYDEEFRLVQEGLGFAEMVAAARYLRKRPFRNSWVVSNHRPYDFLKARFISKENTPEVGYLGIDFYLKRPRPLLVIDEFERWSDCQERADYLSKLGIKVRYANDLKGWKLESFAHEVGVVLCNDTPEELYKTRAFTPRIVEPADPLVWRKLFQNEQNTDQLVARAWELWITQFREQQATRSTPTKLVIEDLEPLHETTGRRLFYDNHAEYFKDRGQDHDVFNNTEFYEFFRDHTPTGLIVEHLVKTRDLIKQNKQAIQKIELKNSENQNQVLRLRKERQGLMRHYRKQRFLLEEAAGTKVVIIDERIQQMLRKYRFGKELNLRYLNPYDYLKGMGIDVPNPECIDHPNFEDPTTFRNEEQKLISYLDDILSNKQADFIVIHIGLLETMLGKSSEAIIDRWIDEHLPESKQIEYVMISGRGKPMAIPERFRYLPYNSISRAILDDCPSKYELCQNLYSSRTRS